MLSGFLSKRFLSGLVIGMVLLVVIGLLFNQEVNRVLSAFGLPTIDDHQISDRDRDGERGGFELPDWPWESGSAPDRGDPERTGDTDAVYPDPAAADIEIADLDALDRIRIDVTEDGIKAGSYDREANFGSGWKDPDGNGCDARNDVLARDLVDITVDDDDCTVLTGTFHDPYTGETSDFERGPSTSAAVQIDHIIALGNAYELGAEEWTQERRLEFANDPANLIASDGPANMSKGAKGANEWMPDNESYHCAYARTQIHVKAKYDLPVGPDEHRELKRALKTC